MENVRVKRPVEGRESHKEKMEKHGKFQMEKRKFHPNEMYTFEIEDESRKVFK